MKLLDRTRNGEVSIAVHDIPPATATRKAEVRRFVKARYGLSGTLSLHRKALGWDLLRAPVNVGLAPVFLIIRLAAVLLSFSGAKRLGAWLAARNIFLGSDMTQQIEKDLHGFIQKLRDQGLGPEADPETIRAQISRHAQTRNAIAEITTSLFVLLAGFLIFNRATPGIISLVGPLAEFRAYSGAVDDFLLGQGMGRMWYGIFPVELTPLQVILTGVVLAVACSLVTTFSGLVADPVQVATGTHQRRLLKLLSRIDRGDSAEKLEPEHLFARFGDIFDTLLSLWRALRS